MPSARRILVHHDDVPPALKEENVEHRELVLGQDAEDVQEPKRGGEERKLVDDAGEDDQHVRPLPGHVAAADPAHRHQDRGDEEASDAVGPDVEDVESHQHSEKGR